MEARLDTLLTLWGCSDPQPLAGDAGARQYFRVQHPHLGKALVVLYPEAPPPPADDPYYDFRALHAYLDPLLPVPTVIQAQDELRAMLLEDLGDQTLELRLSHHPEEEKHWATAVAGQLATWLGILTEGAPPRAFFMLRRFDQAKFTFEWEYCRQHFFREFLEKEPPRWLDRMMEEVHHNLEGRAHHLAHRDFHVRNLMVHGDRLATLDFQDARQGAATYDLASILFDGYWEWSQEAGILLVEGVREELGWSSNLLWEELTQSGLQRNFKALGTFGFQLLQRRKNQFAPAIPRTLRHILGHFQRLNHGEGVLQTEHWIRIAERRLFGG